MSSGGHLGFTELQQDNQAGGGGGGGRAGWQGAAAVTPRGADVLHKEGKEKTDVDNQLFSSLSGWREEGCLGNLLDFGDKLVKRVEARWADRILQEFR